MYRFFWGLSIYLALQYIRCGDPTLGVSRTKSITPILTCESHMFQP